MQQLNAQHIWHNEVRDYELDGQARVNNGCYFNYFEHARHVFLREQVGLDFMQFHHLGYDFVMLKSELLYKASLHGGDIFYVTTLVKQISRLKFAFEQTLHKKPDEVLVCSAINTVCCISAETGKPCLPEQIVALFA